MIKLAKCTLNIYNLVNFTLQEGTEVVTEELMIRELLIMKPVVYIGTTRKTFFLINIYLIKSHSLLPA